MSSDSNATTNSPSSKSSPIRARDPDPAFAPMEEASDDASQPTYELRRPANTPHSSSESTTAASLSTTTERSGSDRYSRSGNRERLESGGREGDCHALDRPSARATSTSGRGSQSSSQNTGSTTPTAGTISARDFGAGRPKPGFAQAFGSVGPTSDLQQQVQHQSDDATPRRLHSKSISGGSEGVESREDTPSFRGSAFTRLSSGYGTELEPIPASPLRTGDSSVGRPTTHKLDESAADDRRSLSAKSRDSADEKLSRSPSPGRQASSAVSPNITTVERSRGSISGASDARDQGRSTSRVFPIRSLVSIKPSDSSPSGVADEVNRRAAKPKNHRTMSSVSATAGNVSGGQLSPTLPVSPARTHAGSLAGSGVAQPASAIGPRRAPGAGWARTSDGIGPGSPLASGSSEWGYPFPRVTDAAPSERSASSSIADIRASPDTSLRQPGSAKSASASYEDQQPARSSFTAQVRAADGSTYTRSAAGPMPVPAGPDRATTKSVVGFDNNEPLELDSSDGFLSPPLEQPRPPVQSSPAPPSRPSSSASSVEGIGGRERLVSTYAGSQSIGSGAVYQDRSVAKVNKLQRVGPDMQGSSAFSGPAMTLRSGALAQISTPGESRPDEDWMRYAGDDDDEDGEAGPAPVQPSLEARLRLIEGDDVELASKVDSWQGRDVPPEPHEEAVNKQVTGFLSPAGEDGHLDANDGVQGGKRTTSGGVTLRGAQGDHSPPDDDIRVGEDADAMLHRKEDADTSSLGASSEADHGLHIMPRFEHKEVEGGHVILTGREGVLQKCEDEPIHIPGAVQPFGCLIACEEDAEGNLVVVQVSENVASIIGFTPKFLFSLDSFADALDDDACAALFEGIDSMDDQARDGVSLSDSGPNTFMLTSTGQLDTSQGERTWRCWCASHRPSPNSRPGLIILELEPDNDNVNPLLTELVTTPTEEDRSGLSGEPYVPTAEDLIQSTTSLVKPLRALVKMRGKGGKAKRPQRLRGRTKAAAGSSPGIRDVPPSEAGTTSTGATISSSEPKTTEPGSNSLEVFEALNQINEQLSKANDLDTFLKITVGVVKELTAFHRVMVYQFDEEWNGQVVAELVDWTRTRDLYRGLHFPASDIPAQARELYKINKVRLLYDRDQSTSRMVCRSSQELESPLDMTHCHLRAMSPIHIKYLANMGVRASMSISIIAFGGLWGLISLHSYGRHGQRISFPMRQMCRVLADSISRNIERLSYAKRLHARQLINTAATDHNPTGYITAKAEDLLKLFDADFGALGIGDEAKIMGNASGASAELLVLLEYFRQKNLTQISASQSINQDYQDIVYNPPKGFEVIAGVLLVPLSRAGKDFMVFFRRAQEMDVHWAGNPYEKVMRAGTYGFLEPRTSFRIWSERVAGRARAWTDEQFETSNVLCLVYGKFIDVWRQKQAALQTNQLHSLLLSNASHEVRTPLNAIINYLEMALDSPLDGETRDNLSKSYDASRALIHVVNDLLDLTRTEQGNDLYRQDPLDVFATVEEAITIHRSEAKRRNIGFEVVQHPPCSQRIVIGDRSKVRQVISNIVANAVKHTQSGKVVLEWGEVSGGDADQVKIGADMVRLGFTVTDTGTGITPEKLDSIFRVFERVQDIDAADDDPEDQRALGLGLAVVARIVHNLDGQLRVESAEGKGSTFTVILAFRLNPAKAIAASGVLAAPGSPDNTSGSRSSLRRVGSGTSFSSGGGKSEIDSLVEAISAPILDSPATGSRPPSADGAPSTSMRPIMPAREPSRRFSANRLSDGGQRGGEVPIASSSTPLRSVKIDPMEIKGRPSIPGFARDANLAHDAHHAHDSSPPPPVSGLQATGGPTPAQKVASRDEALWQPRSFRILVVEDEQVNRTIMKVRLTKLGHKVEVALDGNDAVEKYCTRPAYDIILMDLQMPHCDGLEATRRIRADEQKRGRSEGNDHPIGHQVCGRLPIIAVSASLPESSRGEIASAGLDGWALKPVNMKNLEQVMLGSVYPELRRSYLYKPDVSSLWERGGWLEDVDA